MISNSDDNTEPFGKYQYWNFGYEIEIRMDTYIYVIFGWDVHDQRKKKKKNGRSTYFMPLVFFYTPWKHQETSDVFSAYRKISMVRNGFNDWNYSKLTNWPPSGKLMFFIQPYIELGSLDYWLIFMNVNAEDLKLFWNVLLYNSFLPEKWCFAKYFQLNVFLITSKLIHSFS